MNLVLNDKSLPPATPDILEKIALIEARIRPRENTLQVEMQHHLHAGMYARTARIAANQVITSVFIQIPTLLIVNGDCVVLAGDKWYELTGYNVIPASEGRKQIYVTRGATEITMIFPTHASCIGDAEEEFTNEAGSLLSRRTQ